MIIFVKIALALLFEHHLNMKIIFQWLFKNRKIFLKSKWQFCSEWSLNDNSHIRIIKKIFISYCSGNLVHFHFEQRKWNRSRMIHKLCSTEQYFQSCPCPLWIDLANKKCESKISLQNRLLAWLFFFQY